MTLAAHITGNTKVVGLIGWPVGHSISPAMHNAAFYACKLPWCYIPLPVNPSLPDAVACAVRGLATLGLAGANVTVPHKQNVMSHLDTISPAAQAIGAVNTISVVEDGTLRGDNTDAQGFVADIVAHGCNPQGASALLLGAGGSARAVAYGLADAGCEQITIANRTYERAVDLCARLQHLFPSCTWNAIAGPHTSQPVASDEQNSPLQSLHPDIVVNCTSLGMLPYVDTSPWPQGHRFSADQFVYDLVYNPSQTRFLHQAQQDGARAVGGLGMLVHQGAIAFSIWTGVDAPVEVMENAVATAMATREN